MGRRRFTATRTGSDMHRCAVASFLSLFLYFFQRALRKARAEAEEKTKFKKGRPPQQQERQRYTRRGAEVKRRNETCPRLIVPVGEQHTPTPEHSLVP